MGAVPNQLTIEITHPRRLVDHLQAAQMLQTERARQLLWAVIERAIADACAMIGAHKARELPPMAVFSAFEFLDSYPCTVLLSSLGVDAQRFLANLEDVMHERRSSVRRRATRGRDASDVSRLPG